MLRTYKDIPVALGKLYDEEESDYVKQRHGNDLQISIEGYGGATTVTSFAVTKRRKRQVAMLKDSFSADEEHVFERLHTAFSELAEEFGGKTIFEITDIFMKVSGDLGALRTYLEKGAEGEPMKNEWSYIEDIALSMPENSAEFRDLLVTKGKEEIEKRKFFLLSSGSGLHHSSTAGASAAAAPGAAS